ncbi:MAG: hypothetical protein NZ480_06940, partial [Bdellovibrionaceae bacterium]|nr:hypothetical protein [Pseudobdellovibrionaceae bacterium]MDW8191145.1 hypothetical protein [Pseudobdellovibrionaceae bacterium]
RVLRRHLTFFDFCLRALINRKIWSELTAEQKEFYWENGLRRWYTKNVMEWDQSTSSSLKNSNT